MAEPKKLFSFDMPDEYEKHTASIKTKTIVTIGPNSCSQEDICRLLRVGMDIARLNISHADHQWHAQVIKLIRDAEKRENKHCAIMIDLKGPHIRTGFFKPGIDKVELKKGQKFAFYTNFIRGNQEGVTISYWDLPKLVKAGDKLVADYGAVSFTVESSEDKTICTTVDFDGILGENKTINVRGSDRPIELQFMSYEDTVDVDFAVQHGADFLGACYVTRPEDIEEIRRLTGVEDSGIHILAKLEGDQGLKHAQSIIQVADGVILPRSDIAVDMPVEQVAHHQKRLIHAANVAGKPVIIANQILNSMIWNPRPTRAECTDIANAVLEGADGICLTNTTAIGKYPIETVEMSRRQYKEVEKGINHRKKYHDMREQQAPDGLSNQGIVESIASSAVKTAWDVDATLMIAITKTGQLIRDVGKYRPHTPLLCMTPSYKTARQAQICRGAVPLIFPAEAKDPFALTKIGLAFAKENGLAQEGELVVVIYGEGHDWDSAFSYQVVTCT